MRTICKRHLLFPAAAAALAAACGGGGDGEGPAETPGPTPGSGIDCERETRDDPYVPGRVVDGERGVFQVTLVASDPAPPDKGDNTWTLEVTERAGGQPVDGATIEITPFMPDHGHGTPIRAQVTAGGAPGVYRAGPVNTWMPGYWEVSVSVVGSDGRSDRVVFKLCIEG
jgi:hypothetical protein